MNPGVNRYYIHIKTEPQAQWKIPRGWSWANLEEAKCGARRAAEQWMTVGLIDGETGKKIQY